jgi:hypothetical protein
MEIRRLALMIYKIAIHSGLINLIQFPLVSIQICLAKGPGLRHG